MDEDSDGHTEFDRIGTVAEQVFQLEMTLEPSKEEFDLPAPPIALDDFYGRQIEAIGQQVIGLCARSLALCGSGRFDLRRDQAHPCQDGTGPIVGAPECELLVGEDAQFIWFERGLWGQGHLERSVDEVMDSGLGLEARDEVDASCTEESKAAVAIEAQIEDEGASGQRRQGPDRRATTGRVSGHR